MKRQCARLVLAGSLVLASSMAQSAVVEEVVDMPIHVKNRFGVGEPQTMKVVIWRDDAITTPQPLVVINHGRSNKERTTMPLARYPAQAKYFVAKGFTVFVPTRVGYGPTGGPDVDDEEACNNPQYTYAFDVTSLQVQKVIEFAKTKDYVDGTKIVVAGVSYGGTTAIAAAARNIPGVVGAINFAGGGGGRPTISPMKACRTDLLENLFADYGKKATVPTIWLYSENDQYMGTEYPRQWAEAYVKKGGKAEFVVLPPFGADGHISFTGNMKVWKPIVDQFLQTLPPGDGKKS